MPTSTKGTLDVSEFMHGLRFSRYHAAILVLCSLVTFFDGQDFAALAYALPYIRDDMGMSNEMTGYVTSAAFLGQMIGSLFGSYLGDIVGRRAVIIASTMASAMLTVLVGFADTPEHLIILRFVSGLAIGGLMAPVWALSIESMPRSMRATSVTIVMMGFSIGSASAGPIANVVAPILGWQGIFWICGAMTGVFAVILLFMLPESARWMVVTEKPAERIAAALQRFKPDFDSSAFSQFVLADERKVAASSNPLTKFRELFVGAMLLVTPLIWAAYFFSSFAIFLKSAYGVIFMENLGIARQDAASLSSMGSLFGAFAGVAILALTEKRGPGWIALAPAIAIPALVMIGWGYALGGPLLVPVLFAGAVLVGAGHSAVISIASIYYPSSVRATGGGWASFMAKFAAVAAPILGARFLAGSAGAMSGYRFTAYCLAGIVVCVLLLAFFSRGLAGRTQHARA